MSVRPVDAQRSFYHTDYLAGDLFGPANRYRLFREKIWPRLLELAPKLEALYCAENGRPPIDPVLLCGVTLLQFMEKVADRGASEHRVYHLGWKYALDLELDYDGFHSTVLVYFRDRLEDNQAERMIFDGIVKLLEDLEHEVGRKKRPEFWDRLWELYVQSKLDWRLSKPQHASRYRKSGQNTS